MGVTLETAEQQGPVDDPSEGVVGPATFEEVYAAHATSTLAVVLALRGPSVGAEDVTQEAFARAYERWEDVGRMARPDLWVQKVALNLATSRLRRAAAELRALTRVGPPEFARGPAPDGDQDFWRAVRRLPPRQAEVVALHYAGDLAVADVAAVVGRAEGTVKAQLHTARQRLATLLVAGEGETP